MLQSGAERAKNSDWRARDQMTITHEVESENIGEQIKDWSEKI